MQIFKSTYSLYLNKLQLVGTEPPTHVFCFSYSLIFIKYKSDICCSEKAGKLAFFFNLLVVLLPVCFPCGASSKEPACQCQRQTQVQSLSWEDPLEKEMATHSSILAWEIPWTEELSGLRSIGSQRDIHS